jgi:hypothetical protein
MRTILNTVALASFVWAAVPALAGEKDVTLYKNPQCGCCEGYADYLRENGFDVAVKATHDLAEMSREAGISDEFQGCHLSFVDGYVVSGHVPVGTVEKLLTERPDIKGVTLPGMPMGSPGMSGTKEAPFEMLEITKSGTVGGVYARE